MGQGITSPQKPSAVLPRAVMPVHGVRRVAAPLAACRRRRASCRRRLSRSRGAPGGGRRRRGRGAHGSISGGTRRGRRHADERPLPRRSTGDLAAGIRARWTTHVPAAPSTSELAGTQRGDEHGMTFRARPSTGRSSGHDGDGMPWARRSARSARSVHVARRRLQPWDTSKVANMAGAFVDRRLHADGTREVTNMMGTFRAAAFKIARLARGAQLDASHRLGRRCWRKGDADDFQSGEYVQDDVERRHLGIAWDTSVTLAVARSGMAAFARLGHRRAPRPSTAAPARAR